MNKLKSADRIKVRTNLGEREVKGEIYRGLGINKDYYELNQHWNLTILSGINKGIAITACRKKNDCRLLADEIIKRINKTDIEKADFNSIKDIVKKYAVKGE